MALLLIAIAIFDLKFHRIPNVAVALVVLLDLALGSLPNSYSLLLFLIPTSFLAWRYLRIGGGDIKLLGAMLVFVLPRESLSDYAFYFILCAIARRYSQNRNSTGSCDQWGISPIDFHLISM